jgi:hypothetical protein
MQELRVMGLGLRAWPSCVRIQNLTQAAFAFIGATRALSDARTQ